MWRTRLMRGVLGIALGVMLFSPGTARAQFIGFPIGGWGWGGNANISYLYARPYMPGMGRGFFPGFNGPGIFNYGAGMNPYAYNPMLYNAAFGMGGGSMGLGNGGTALIFPGFSATQIARKRSTMDPALAVNPNWNAVRPAAFDSNPPDNRARIDVLVPAGAEVALQGVTMKQTGSVRHYVSPPLDPNSKYSYAVRVRWRDSQGEERTETRRVRVWAGANERVDFTSKQ